VTSWQVAFISCALSAAAYLAISLAIAVPLTRSHQLRTNALGAATAAIFFTCAVHRAAISVHLLLPSLGVQDREGLAMRVAWGWPLASWDVVGAVAALYYWSLRRNFSTLQGAQLFQDFRQREQQALELNDSVLQGLVVAKMALDLEQPAKAQQALAASIDSASRIITGLLGSNHRTLELLRSTPATVSGLEPELQGIADQLTRPDPTRPAGTTAAAPEGSRP
jgi:hypothetical protein